MASKAQRITSAATSINSKRVPRLFGLVKDWRPGTHNLDYGGGRYDTATTYLAARGVTNHIYDPYNRSEEENSAALDYYDYDTCTISNVLNVIQGHKARVQALTKALLRVKDGGKVYITVYEGDKSRIGRETKKDCWQENQPLSTYYVEIEHLVSRFNWMLKDQGLWFHAEKRGGMIIITVHRKPSEIGKGELEKWIIIS